MSKTDFRFLACRKTLSIITNYEIIKMRCKRFLKCGKFSFYPPRKKGFAKSDIVANFPTLSTR